MSSLITGTFVGPDGNPQNGLLVLFRPLSTPFVYSAAIVVTKSVSTSTDSNGQISITLQPGAYAVVVGSGSDNFNIFVPDDGAAHDLFDVTSTSLAATGPTSSAQVYTVDKLATVLQNTKTISFTRNADINSTQSTFAFIGNYGDVNHTTALTALVSLIASVSPTAIFGLGNNNYASAPRSGSSYDNIIGQFFHSYIYPYSGSYGAASSNGNMFWPAIGQYDAGNVIGTGYSYADYLSFFQSLSGASPNSRYYTRTIGDIQFFVLNSDKNEPDGYSFTSTQAVWLQTQLAASTAVWKIVCFYQSPYSSVSGYSSTWMQYPFDLWGADVVISSGVNAYERLMVNGVLYFSVGLCSQSADTFGSLNPNSLAHDNTHAGYLRMISSDYSLEFSYIDTGGAVRDTAELLSTNTPTKLFTSANIDPAGGLTVTPAGIAMLNPNTGISSQNNTNPYVLDFGKIILSDTPPDTLANPLYVKCIWSDTSGAFPRFNVWNKNIVQWIPLSDVDKYASLPALTQLPALTFTPTNGGSRKDGITIGNITSSATVYYSIDGSSFSVLTGTLVLFPFGSLGQLAVFQNLTGYAPSDLSIGVFAA